MTMIVERSKEEWDELRSMAIKQAIDDIDNGRDYHPDYNKWPGKIQYLYERSRMSYLETKLKKKK